MVDRGESTGTGARTEVISPARVSARVGAIEESATLAISTRAKALRAQGVHVVDFGAGEPDFPTPPHIVEAASRACADPRNHKYTANAGLPELREAVAEKTRQDTGLHVEPAQVLVTNGGKQSVYQAFATLLDPGDEVLIPAPYWVTYPEAVHLAGGVPVPVETGPGAGFEVSVDALEAAAGERTKVLLFVSPSNPTGVVYPRDHAVEIGRWAAARGLWVVTDEIYQHLVYPPHEFSSLPVEVPELAERSIVISGVSKTYAMTGWRVGWMIGPGDAITAAANLQSHLTSNVNNVAQVAAMAALTGPQDDVARMREAFAARRAMLLGGLRAIAGVECVEPGGAFYAFPSLTGLLGRDLGGATAGSTLELGSLLLDRAGVAVVPGEAFGTPGYARMAYALSESELGEGIERIRALAES